MEPDDPGRGPPLFHGPGESPGNIGEGRGVMSVMAARAGELIADPGDSEWYEAMLAADKVDLRAERSIAMGWEDEVALPRFWANSLCSLVLDSWSGTGTGAVAVGVWPSVRMCRPAVKGERVGVWCEGVRMWTVGGRTVLFEVSRAASCAFWPNAAEFRACVAA
jgi:hypothetical protein